MPVLKHEVLQQLSSLKKALNNLSIEEVKAFAYLWDVVSIGEIIVEHDLRKLYGINDPREVLRALLEANLIERGEGCYNLAPELRKIRRRVKSSTELFRLLDSIP